MRSLNRGKLLATLLSSCRISWKIIVLLWIDRSHHVGFNRLESQSNADTWTKSHLHQDTLCIITLVHTTPIEACPMHSILSPTTFWRRHISSVSVFFLYIRVIQRNPFIFHIFIHSISFLTPRRRHRHRIGALHRYRCLHPSPLDRSLAILTREKISSLNVAQAKWKLLKTFTTRSSIKID